MDTVIKIQPLEYFETYTIFHHGEYGVLTQHAAESRLVARAIGALSARIAFICMQGMHSAQKAKLVK